MLLGTVGSAAAWSATEALRAVQRMHARESDQRLAARFITAVSLWPREDLDRHLGDRPQGPWRLRIDRPLRTVYTGLGERADQIRAAGARVDRDANAERLLRSLWTNLRPSDDSSPIVSGDSTVVEFSAWCESVEGWLRPCRARLAIDHDGRGSQFTLVLAAAATMTMKFWHRDHGLERIRYLRNAENGGHLVTNWRDIVPPLAIVVIAGTDP